jgi:hypothetical protein
VKNMDNLLKLKLDMVYRDLDMETAEKRHSEATATPSKPAQAPPEAKKPVKRRVVKPIDPPKPAKSKVVRVIVPKST